MPMAYDAWFTEYPSTHERAGQTVEVVTRHWLRHRDQELMLIIESLDLGEQATEFIRRQLSEGPRELIA